MADLLSHVLLAYVVLTVASWRIEWLTERWVVVGVAGTTIPDLYRVRLVIDDGAIESLLGAPFTFGVVETVGVAVLIAAAIAALFERDRSRAFAMILAGALVHFLVDGMRMYADGASGFWLYPIWWRPPTPNLYVSSDPRVLAASVLIAAAVFAADRHLSEPASDPRPT